MEVRAMPYSLVSLAAAILLLGARPARGSAIASWWVDTDEQYSPQIFKYNATTNKIYGSLCNSITTPVFAQNDSTAISLTITPRTGTNIASLGYVSDDVLQANVFYLADLDNEATIVSAAYTCDNTTGLWTPASASSSSSSSSSSSYNEYISNGTQCAETAPAVEATGGLSALYLSKDDGMRVFFKTAAFQTHYLQYQFAGASCAGWSYVGIASNLTTGNEVSAALLGSKPHVWTIAQTVFVNESASADTNGEIEISTSNHDGIEDLWSINRMPIQIIAELKEDNSTAGILTNMSTTPSSAYTYKHTDSWGFTLDAFAGAAARVGVAVDSGGIPSVFYLGTDGYLRRFAADTQGHWHEDDSEDDSKWPAARAPSADFGLAYDASGNRVWLYYDIGGGSSGSDDEEGGAMAQVYQSGSNTWDSFTTLSTSSSSSSSSGSSSSSSSSGASGNSTTSTASSSTGLTSDAKVGLGVGLGLGIPLVAVAAAAVILLLRRRKHSRLAKRHRLESQYSSGSPTHHKGIGGGGMSPTHTASPTTPTTALSGPDQNQGYWQDGMWIEKSATTYYAGGGLVGPGANTMPGGQLGELPTRPPVFEMSGHGVAHEMAAAGEHR